MADDPNQGRIAVEIGDRVVALEINTNASRIAAAFSRPWTTEPVKEDAKAILLSIARSALALHESIS